MTSRGRKEFGIWQHFIKKKVVGKLGCRAVCKKCGKELQGLVDRLKSHWETCKSKTSDISGLETLQSDCQSQPGTSQNEIIQLAKKQRSENCDKGNVGGSENSGSSGHLGHLSSFVVRTGQDKKKELDRQIAKAVYATNCSFRAIENKEIRKAIEMLRPGYVPPSRFQLSSTLLNEIFEEEKSKCFNKFSGQSVCMSLDGWSNIHNEPIICVVLTAEDGNSVLLESIDTSGHPHTADYLAELAINAINKCKNEYNCKVTSVVTDNAANMVSMKKKITESLNYPIFTYGCSAHLLSLLSKDLETSQVKEHIVEIVKYFRNTHLPNAWYKEKGGKKLVLPQDVRWNTLSDCLEIYVNEWPKLLLICEEHKEEIDPVIFKKVSDIYIKRMAEDFLQLLKPISIALDAIQQKGAFLSRAVQTWKKLIAIFDSFEEERSLHQYQLFKKRYVQALTPFHFLAYILDPTINKEEYPLLAEEKRDALGIVSQYFANTGLLPLLIKLEARSDPFHKTMFSDEIIKNVTAVQWWRSQEDVPEIKQVLPIVISVLCACASSADIERMFSSYGLVHSDIRNRLGNDKAAKLVFLFKHYNT